MASVISCKYTYNQRFTDEIELLAEAGDRYWVTPLLAHAITRAGMMPFVPPAVAEKFRHQIAFESSFELLTRAEVGRVATAFGEAGVPMLLVKGAAIAYTHYPAPHLRPRLDTDLLVSPASRADAIAGLDRLGYEQVAAVDGPHIVHQSQHVRRLRAGLLHAIDLHWKIFNPNVFADLFSFEVLERGSIPLPALGPYARTTGLTDTLLLAMIHRAAHHERDRDLLALYDLHALASAMSDDEWRGVVGFAEAHGLRGLAAESLDTTRGLFATPLPDWVRMWAAEHRDAPLEGAFRPFELRGRRTVDVLASDLRALGWGERVALLREHLLPPPAYIMRHYGVRRPYLLPWFYVRRIVRGAPRWFRRDTYR